MSLNSAARSPNSSLVVTGTVTPSSPPRHPPHRRRQLVSGRVSSRLSSSATTQTTRTMAAVDKRDVAGEGVDRLRAPRPRRPWRREPNRGRMSSGHVRDQRRGSDVVLVGRHPDSPASARLTARVSTGWSRTLPPTSTSTLGDVGRGAAWRRRRPTNSSGSVSNSRETDRIVLSAAGEVGLAGLAEAVLLPALASGHHVVDARRGQLQRQDANDVAAAADRGQHPRRGLVVGRRISFEIGDERLVDRGRLQCSAGIRRRAGSSCTGRLNRFVPRSTPLYAP